MRDFILSFTNEATAIAALPGYRADDTWTGPLIPDCTRWIQRPVYNAEGELVTPPESVSGWHCIVRAASLPEAAQPSLVTEPTDIEPIPAGGLLVLVVPEAVSALQGMLAINAAGMAAGFNAWLAALDPIDDFAAIAFFQKAATWRRDNTYLNQGAMALGLTDAQIDGLFTLAATL